MRRSLTVLAVAGMVVTLTAVGAAEAAAADRLECQVARFEKRWRAVDRQPTGFPGYDFSVIETQTDFFRAYADGQLEDYSDYPGQGWTLTEQRATGSGTSTVFDADFNVVGQRLYTEYSAEYERVDPEAGLRAGAVKARAKIGRQERLWRRARTGVLRYSKRSRSYDHRWLVRRSRAYTASARFTRARLAEAIQNPADVAIVRTAVKQASRYESAVSSLGLRMPYSSLFSCYR
jgi:hypothetical protein